MELNELDFRIYDRKNREYITEDKLEGVGLGIEKCTNTLAFLHFIDDKTIDYYHDVEIELFTGYLDQTGKKIYENDILKIEGVKAEVKFINGAFRLVANGRYIGTLHKCCKKSLASDNKTILTTIVKGNNHESGLIY